MGKGDSNVNFPTPPTYGEGMREALEAQVALLAGTQVGDADFSQFEGGLRELVREYEAPLRRETAQIDTDVLRQTLLGTEREFEVRQDPETGKFGIPDQAVVKGEDGEPQTAGDGRYQVVQLTSGTAPQTPRNLADHTFGTTPEFGILDTVKGGITGRVGGEQYWTGEDGKFYKPTAGLTPAAHSMRSYVNTNSGRMFLDRTEAEALDAGANIEEMLQTTARTFQDLRNTIEEDGVDAVPEKFTFQNPYTGDDLEEGETITVREGDGMIDLLGDRRQAIDPATGLPTERQAGFDEQGNFLGLSALAEDVQRGNLSRQREADLADVERLSGRFQEVMADYRPGTTEALAGAREVLEAQRQRLVGQPASDQVDKSPLAVLNQGFQEIEEDYQSTLDQYGPEAADAVREDAMNRLQASAATAGLTMDQVQAGPQAQPAQLTGFQDPTFTAETQLTGDAGLLGVLQSATQADVDAGRATKVGDTIQVDPLRARLIQDARSALGEGLTEREETQIAEAARARATMMGRTFDQSEAIAEAQARVAEDNQRRMQNRAFASQILGQEAGLQSGDLGRGMQQELRQVGADMDAERLRQAQTAGFIDASTRLAGLEASTTMDPFAALLNRAGGGSLQAGQGVFGQAQYGLASGPQFLNPESGLGFISQMAANEASMYGAQQQANAARSAGLMQGLGSLGGGIFGNLNIGPFGS